ncbi:MAG: hypothetical protein DWQ02_14205 [Bacteroidetes bacterium]|nr:MAG: hypothetical protein DWQ02_14205 [Bacteroidota bacterium]
MKFKFFIIFILGASLLYGQKAKSDLYFKVDSIIKYELKFKFDSLKSVVQKPEWDTTKQRGLYPSFSSFPEHPPPLIILDHTIYQIEGLNDYKLRHVERITVYMPGDSISTLLYRKSAINGTVIITTKKHARKTKKNNRKEKRRKIRIFKRMTRTN